MEQKTEPTIKEFPNYLTYQIAMTDRLIKENPKWMEFRYQRSAYVDALAKYSQLLQEEEEFRKSMKNSKIKAFFKSLFKR